MTEQAKKLSTVEDLLFLISSNERAELIEGDIVYKAIPSAEHGFAATKIAQSLSPYSRKGGGGGNAPGGWWIGSEIHVIYEGRPNGFLHDLVGWRRDRHIEKPKGTRVTTKPDWVCEILSTNRVNDLVSKKWVLHEHRVEFFWLVDIERQVLSVLRWNEKGYIIIADVKPSQRALLEPFSEIELDISVLFGGDAD
jgi:Uma2 family endonuclease